MVGLWGWFGDGEVVAPPTLPTRFARVEIYMHIESFFTSHITRNIHCKPLNYEQIHMT